MVPQKKYLIILETFGLGGAERQALNLARYLRDTENSDIKIIAFSGPGRASELCEEYNLPWEIIPFAWSHRRFDLFKRLIKVAISIRKEKATVLLPYTWMPNVVSGLIWKFTGAATCIWNQRDEGIGLDNRRIYRCAVNQTPFFLSNSMAGYDFLRRTYGVEENKVRIIHNGVSLTTPLCGRSEWRARIGVDQKAFLAIMVANLHEYKDHVTLIKAWRRVLGRIPNSDSAILLLAGKDYGLQNSLANLASELGIADKVVFLGQVADISGLLQAVDLGVHSSKFEGCPNSVLEFMVAGLPVVGTDIMGLREALGLGNYTNLAPPGDDEVLATMILKFYRDTQLRASVGRDNQLYVGNMFSFTSMCESTVKHITKCLMN